MSEIGQLVVRVIQGKELIAQDAGGTSDPFVILYINEKERLETKKRMKTLNPVWFEDFGFYSQGKPATLHLIAEDWDLVGKNDSLGNASVKLDDLVVNVAVTKWVKLDGVKSGQVQISLLWIPLSLFDPAKPLPKAGKMHKFRIVLERVLYAPGDTIRGYIVWSLSAAKSYKTIAVQIAGRTHTFFDTAMPMQALSGPTRNNYSYATHHIFDHEALVAGTKGGTGAAVALESGVYCWPFEFGLPPTVPPSVEWDKSANRYFITAHVDSTFKASAPFRVITTKSFETDAMSWATSAKSVAPMDRMGLAFNRNPFDLLRNPGQAMANHITDARKLILDEPPTSPSISVNIPARMPVQSQFEVDLTVVNSSPNPIATIDLAILQTFRTHVWEHGNKTLPRHHDDQDQATGTRLTLPTPLAPGETFSQKVSLAVPFSTPQTFYLRQNPFMRVVNELFVKAGDLQGFYLVNLVHSSLYPRPVVPATEDQIKAQAGKILVGDKFQVADFPLSYYNACTKEHALYYSTGPFPDAIYNVDKLKPAEQWTLTHHELDTAGDYETHGTYDPEGYTTHVTTDPAVTSALTVLAISDYALEATSEPYHPLISLGAQLGNNMMMDMAQGMAQSMAQTPLNLGPAGQALANVELPPNQVTVPGSIAPQMSQAAMQGMSGVVGPTGAMTPGMAPSPFGRHPMMGPGMF